MTKMTNLSRKTTHGPLQVSKSKDVCWEKADELSKILSLFGNFGHGNRSTSNRCIMAKTVTRNQFSTI